VNLFLIFPSKESKIIIQFSFVESAIYDPFGVKQMYLISWHSIKKISNGPFSISLGSNSLILEYSYIGLKVETAKMTPDGS